MRSNIQVVIVENKPGDCRSLGLPVGQESLVERLFTILGQSDISDIFVVTSKTQNYAKLLASQAAEARALSLHWQELPSFQGTAGSLKALHPRLHAPQVLVLHAALFLRQLDIPTLVSTHRRTHANITFVTEHKPDDDEDLENLIVDHGGAIESVQILHRSRNRRRPLRSCGIYLMDRETLEHIPANDYFDIKEQLVPAVRAKGLCVRSHTVRNSARLIRTAQDLLRINRELLLGHETRHEHGARWLSHANRIVIGENTQIAPTSYLLGPLVIGPNCVVEDYAQVIGPAVIGARTTLEKGSTVRESVVWTGAHIRTNAHVEYSFLGSDAVIPEGIRVHSALWASDNHSTGHPHEDTSSTPHDGWLEHEPPPLHRPSTGTSFWVTAYEAAKRSFDLAAASIGLLLALPIAILITIAIVLDSPGPVLFCQRRCGRGGVEFSMLKFRTMVVDAEQQQHKLRTANATDGPMFKLQEDPRITRVGRLLRKTSLDELPQLLNVLNGDMSLVGPRPLAYQEMKYCPSWRDLRLTVKPGVTGLWQVRARHRNQFSEWIRYDMDYVRQRSFFFDLRILLQTVGVLLKGV
ncbi:MAG: sugar transferase [Nitrospiraceae bacterium]